MTDIAMKREMSVREKGGLRTSDLVLAAVLIAAGAVFALACIAVLVLAVAGNIV